MNIVDYVVFGPVVSKFTQFFARNQSTCFDNRVCWCLPPDYERATAMKEAPDTSPEAFLDEEAGRCDPGNGCYLPLKVDILMLDFQKICRT